MGHARYCVDWSARLGDVLPAPAATSVRLHFLVDLERERSNGGDDGGGEEDEREARVAEDVTAEAGRGRT